MNTTFVKCSVLCLASLLCALRPAHAGEFADADIDPRFRAKIIKQKIKMKAAETENFNFNSNAARQPDAECGSQNIGNVDTGGKIGRGPREVFVFAPNAINLVNGRGCQ